MGASVSVVVGKSKAKKMKDDLFVWDLGCWRSLLKLAQQKNIRYFFLPKMAIGFPMYTVCNHEPAISSIHL